MTLFLDKETVTSDISDNALLAYVALRHAMSDSISLVGKSTTKMYVSSEQLCYNLTGNLAGGYLPILQKGVAELQARELITVEDASKHGWVLDCEKLYVNTEKQYFVMVENWEISKILNCEEITYCNKRVALMRYFIALISTFDNSASFEYGAGKIGHMTIDFIAAQAHTSLRTAKRYNDELSDLKLIYIYRTNDKIVVDGKLKQIKNTYSRYKYKEICIAFGENAESQGYIHQVVIPRKNKEQADRNRSLGAKYNALLNWYTGGEAYKYDENTIREVYRYVDNKNKQLNELIADKEEQCKRIGKLSESEQKYLDGLKEQLRNLDFLEEYKPIPTKDESQEVWGDPLPVDDWSDEELLYYLDQL